MKLGGEAAEEAAAVIEKLIADVEELRALRDVASGASRAVEAWLTNVGARSDIPSARVTLLNVLSAATEGDLRGEDDRTG